MQSSQWPRDALRVQRYLDGKLEGTYKLVRGADPDGPEACAALDAEWTAQMVAAGHDIRIEIDDPHNDIAVKVVIVNGVAVDCPEDDE